MRSIKVFLLIALVVLITAALGFFGFQNMESVSVRFFHWELPEKPLFIYLLLAAVAGMAVSIAIFGFEILRLRARAHKENKLRVQYQSEVDALRNQPLYEENDQTELDVDEPDEEEEKRETAS